MKHVMIDLETWGSGVDAVIIDIGAVVFEMGGEVFTPIECFDLGVHPKGQVEHFKRKIDSDTIEWWMNPAQDAARAAWQKKDKVDFVSAMEGFRQWLSQIEGEYEVWSNASTFDIMILRNAYGGPGFQEDAPWKFRKENCHRTLKKLAPGINPPDSEGQHEALSDALWQAEQAWMICKHLGIETL